MDQSLRENDHQQDNLAEIRKHKRSKRVHWAGKLDFIVTCIGFSVGLGNVWRFPYLCYKNGGGAFLIPYLVSVLTVGIPMVILEVFLGQYMQLSGPKAWNICPLFQGIGAGTMVSINWGNICYIVIMAWAGYYLVMSWNSVLPWSHCNNTWNTNNCLVNIKNTDGFGWEVNRTNYSVVEQNYTVNYTVDPAVEFWNRKVLQLSDAIDKPDGLVWPLVLSLFIMWLVCYLCVFYGIRLTGKIMYLCATLPYLMLAVLLIRGVTLPGATSGIIYYLRPDFKRLGSGQVWIDAATQVFYSYGTAFGTLTTAGSYNEFHKNTYRQCILIAAVNCGTSLMAGFAIFSVLGFMAEQQGVSIDQVADKGPGLAFIVYPTAISQIPGGPLWASLFFVVIIILGIDTEFMGIETVISPITDIYPKLRTPKMRALLVALYCCCCFCLGLSMVTRGGIYVFQLFDYYAVSGFTLLWTVFWECVAIAWIYKAGRFLGDIQIMIGHRLNRWFWLSWSILTPVITAFIFVFQLVTYKGLVYNRSNEFPSWVDSLGMYGLAFSSMICVPLGAVINLIIYRGNIGKLVHPNMNTDPVQENVNTLDCMLKQQMIETDHEILGGD